MKTTLNIDDIFLVKNNMKIELECEFCMKKFYTESKFIKSTIRRKISDYKFCSRKCAGLAIRKRIDTKCGFCDKSISVLNCIVNKSKSGKVFCSQSCSATYRNKNKTSGCIRSKLEIWIEQELKNAFIEFEILFNRRDIINSELDIYFPSLNLAFELNGITHYKPIYGLKKFNSIKNNDEYKLKKCIEYGIELVVLNTSNLKKFNIDDSTYIFNIIKNYVLQKK